MKILPLPTMCAILSVLGPPERVSAYTGESGIGYDTETITLSGYSRTWKDPADWDFESGCLFWEYDIDFGFYCSRFHVRYAFAAVNGWIDRQSQDEPVSSAYAAHIETARTDYSTTSPDGDVWTAQADHLAQVDNYLVFCSLTTTGSSSCAPRIYVGTQVYWLTATTDSETVCGEPEVDELYREYPDDRYRSTIRPECEDFSNSGGSTHFSWDEINGKHSPTTVVRGNPHLPWAMVTQGLRNGLDSIVANHSDFDGILLTSGYRCPHGNQIVGGVANSYHTHGRAADLWRNGWTESEYNEVRDVARDAGALSDELFDYTFYSDHHLHVAF